MSIFEVFNERSAFLATVRNSLDSAATAQSVSKAADKIAGAVEKAADNNAKDTANAVSKSVEKVVSAVKDSAEKVSETVKRTATNNEAVESRQYASESHPLALIYDEMSNTVRRVSDFVDANPEIAPKKMQDFNRQLVAMIEGVDTIGEANHKLDYAKDILEQELKAGNGGNQSTAVRNSYGRVVGCFNALLD